MPNERPTKVENESEYRKFAEYLKKEYQPKDGSRCASCPLYEITLTVKGQYENIPKRELETRGFGHLNSYDSQLTIHSVSDVLAKPIDPSIYEGRK